MVLIRPFNNFDPPRFLQVWNASLKGPRAVAFPPESTTILELFTLAKPYFDREGLLLAFNDEQTPVGFIHAGFGVAPDQASLDKSRGVICSIGVVSSHRRQGIGTQLLKRAEEYLRSRGAQEILAGPIPQANPFTFGIYGGCDSTGFLASDGLARPFFEHHGYHLHRSTAILQVKLRDLKITPDPRAGNLRQLYEIVGGPFSKVSWWQEAVLGPIDAVEFRLRRRKSGAVVGRIVLWDMVTYSVNHPAKESGVGLLLLEIEPESRGHGLGQFLLTQVLLHLKDQTFDRFEVAVPHENESCLKLFRSLGFQEVDTGFSFRRLAQA
ncbi:MAG: GNAT family N-acetyltransferase [Gemmataceae bacterium]